MLVALLMLWWQAAELTTVEGRVVDALTNQPVEKARIVLLRTDRPNAYGMKTFEHPARAWDADPSAVQMAVDTGADGSFRFRVASPAKFRLFSSAKGYVRQGMAFDEVVQYEWKAGGENKRIGLRLMPEVGISGRVIDAETGQGVRGLAVAPYRRMVQQGSTFTAMAGEIALTDDQGRYALTGLKPGGYLLEVRPPRGLQFQKPKPVENFKRDIRMGYRASWYPGVEIAEQAESITLFEGGNSGGHDMRVVKRRVAAIRGKLVGDESLGEFNVMLEEAKVTRNSGSFGLAGQGKLRPGQEFELEPVMPGTYCLIATTMGNTRERKGGILRFEVHEENLDGLEVTLYPAAVVTGRVHIQGADPKPGESTLPKADMVVGLLPLGRAGLSGEDYTAVEPKDGRFRLEGYLHDRYYAYAGKLPEGFRVAEVRMNGTVAPHGVVTLDSQAPKLELEFDLAPASGSVQATVNDGIDPAVGATVVLLREPLVEDVLIRTLRRATTDSQGRATINGLLPGTYRLVAYAKNAMWIEADRLPEQLRSGFEVKVGESGGAILAQVSVIAP
jgi:protocatechuate 3,4-dioxygenase beta subunit